MKTNFEAISSWAFKHGLKLNENNAQTIVIRHPQLLINIYLFYLLHKHATENAQFFTNWHIVIIIILKFVCFFKDKKNIAYSLKNYSL